MPVKTDFANKKKINFGTTETKVVNMQDFDRDTIVSIPVELLTKADNIRDVLTDNDQELEELGESIKEYGQIQPIVVAKDGDKYKILMGSRRFKAAIKTGIPTLRCQVVDDFKDIKERILKQAIENEQRKNMSAQERENYIAELINLGMKQTEIANALHKSKTWINLILTAKETRDKNSEEFEKLSFEPSTKDAIQLAKLTDEGLKNAIAETIKEGNNKEVFHEKIEEQKKKEKLTKERKADEDVPEKTPETFEFSEISDGFENDEKTETSENIILSANITIQLEKESRRILSNRVYLPQDPEMQRFLESTIEEYLKGKGYN